MPSPRTPESVISACLREHFTGASAALPIVANHIMSALGENGYQVTDMLAEPLDDENRAYVQIAVRVPLALEEDSLALALIAEAAQDYVNETYDEEGNPR